MNTNEIIDLYIQGKSLKELSKNFNIKIKDLKELLNNSKIHIRNQKEQIIITNVSRTKNIDHYYFNQPNNNNMYYLGFLGADGTVRKNRNEIKIGLSSIDKDFLEEFKNNLKSEKQIKNRITNNGFECSEFTFSSAQIKQDLINYGVVPNKTYKGLDLDLIPNEYKYVFIKGFFDGDGSISINNKTKQIKLSFVSHSKNFLDQINTFLNNKGYIYKKKGQDNYSLEFSTIPALEILQNFYMINSPCLKRKYLKYLSALELRK